LRGLLGKTGFRWRSNVRINQKFGVNLLEMCEVKGFVVAGMIGLLQGQLISAAAVSWSGCLC
jgi:hypothetical protein